MLYWSDAGATPYGRMRVRRAGRPPTTVVDALASAARPTWCWRAMRPARSWIGSAEPRSRWKASFAHGLASVPDELPDRSAWSAAGAPSTPVSTGAAWPGADGWCYRGWRSRCRRISRPAAPAPRSSSPIWRRFVAPLRRVDALVLACTHYPAANPWFAAALPHALLIDPAERLAAAIAQRYPHTRKTSRRGMRVFLTTGDPEAMRRGAVHAWGTALTAKVVRA